MTDKMKIIEVKQSVFADNDADAEKLRKELKSEKTFLLTPSILTPLLLNYKSFVLTPLLHYSLTPIIYYLCSKQEYSAAG